ncbi:exodeoxyribonuclease III [Rickettsia australis]|uniref:Exodeoxyribonuclease III n=1 Tax=Rickettsia australis (strain Cutlack) TaxID=1105110 RepID=H8K895_RICAC|nr:exodeoxyribonuclease III [Rickettsia australis]AFC71488.1 exodeoxyribonuclease III [Rickettsia australis str. Cutlack]
MKIVTWNINSLRLRIDLLRKLVYEYQPDIILLQETKVSDSLFPLEVIKNIGYEHVIYSGQKSYNGVAIISKFPLNNVFSLELYNSDKRHIAAIVNDIEIHNFYVPAGGDIPDIEVNLKFKHKLEYVRLMQEWLTTNRTRNDKIIIVGDLNIAPNEHDVWSSKQLRNVISHTDIERSLLVELQNSLSFIDSSRHFVPLDEKFYTWWSYRNIDWKKSNRGRRLDHIWVSDNLKDALFSMHLLSEARDWLPPSDHVPYFVTLDVIPVEAGIQKQMSPRGS